MTEINYATMTAHQFAKACAESTVSADNARAGYFYISAMVADAQGMTGDTKEAAEHRSKYLKAAFPDANKDKSFRSNAGLMMQIGDKYDNVEKTARWILNGDETKYTKVYNARLAAARVVRDSPKVVTKKMVDEMMAQDFKDEKYKFTADPAKQTGPKTFEQKLEAIKEAFGAKGFIGKKMTEASCAAVIVALAGLELEPVKADEAAEPAEPDEPAADLSEVLSRAGLDAQALAAMITGAK